ncbi:MAG: GGDEF domain-containing protein [Selenomonadaceae bacterium]|nr:GGDEF domain-containing protein [Selenomonadaceae bacterium]
MAVQKEGLTMGQNERELHEESSPKDPITGLPTRIDLTKALDEELKSDDISGAMMVIGLDNFQLVNEICGPAVGDEAMRQIAENIANVLPFDITLYQVSSDQFALYWHDAMPEELEIIFASLQLSLRDIAAIEDKIYCTTTAGVAFYPRDGKDTNTLLKFAQAAKTIGKAEGGGDRICFFNQESYDKWHYKVMMEGLMKNSIARGCEEFMLYFQPQVWAKDGSLYGAEALLRWRTADGQILPPLSFIPVLEKTRLIIPAGHWIIEQAVKTCKKFQEYLPDFQMSINISLYQLEEQMLYPFVADCIERHGVKPSSIVFELTEGQNVTDWEFVNSQFEAFRNLGIKIAMDDFGSGYATLDFLKEFKCDLVKLDRSVIIDMLKDDYNKNLVKYSIALCHAIDLALCVEGVEDEDVYKYLRDECGAEMIQGFYFGKPEPEDVFMQRLVK